MTKSMTRRMLVAGALVGTLLGALPGKATTLAVISTSVDNGFASVNPIAARFNAGLSATLSTATLADKLGVPVTAVVRRISSGSGPDGDSLLLTPNYNELNELLSPYTVTFTAVDATATPETTVAVREFWLDLKKGNATITTPAKPGEPRIVAPGEELAVAGYAFDDYAYDTVAGELKPRTLNRSGLASVEVKLYKLNPAVRNPGVTPGTPPEVTPFPFPPTVDPGTAPSVTPPVIQPSQEVLALRHAAALSDCARASCIEGEKTWTANVEGLGQGSWTLQAVAIDVAGNRSAIAETSFIIL